MNRIRVSQTDARQLTGGPRAPLSVGIVRRDPPGGDAQLPPRLGVVIKLGLRFDGSDGIRVAEPEPLVTGAESASAFELPLGTAHLFVEGHAHAEMPTLAIKAKLVIGGVTSAFEVSSSSPLRSIPLDPKPQPLPGVRVESDVLLELEGLSPTTPRRELRLPGLEPRAWLDLTAGRTEIALSCETVHLDTDFERVTLIYRGLLPERWTDFEIDGLVVSLEQRRQARTEDEVMRFLPRGTFTFAEEEGDAPEGDPDVLEMASYEALEHGAEPDLSLAQFATIAARMAEGDPPRKDVLDAHDLDERSWAIEERAWMERMGDRAAAGDGTLSAEFGERFVAEQDALAGPNEPRPRSAYLALKALVDNSDQPAETLKAEGVRFGEWCRLERHWSKR